MKNDITPAWKTSINNGNTALAEGKAYGALGYFTAAEGHGLPPALIAVHTAMAHLMLGRHDKARSAVASALPHATGIFVHAQLCALLALADSLEGKPDDGALARLENCLLELAGINLSFDLDQSDLQYLLHGLVARRTLAEGPRSIFRLLVAWPSAAAA